MAYTRVASQIIADAAPTAGSIQLAPENDSGDSTIVDGMWIYTRIGASGLADTPSAGGHIIVNLYPRGAVASGAGAVTHDNDVLHSFTHQVTRDGAYEFADFCSGRLPRYTKVGVLNATGQAFTASQLDVSIEYIKVTA